MNEIVELECGCVFTKSGKAFIVKPCSMLCANFIWIMDESAQVGNAVMFVRVKELRK